MCIQQRTGAGVRQAFPSNKEAKGGGKRLEFRCTAARHEPAWMDFDGACLIALAKHANHLQHLRPSQARLELGPTPLDSTRLPFSPLPPPPSVEKF